MGYPGGKGRESVYQAIINQMPPHSIYVEPFLGGASVMMAKRPALLNIGVDKNQAALSAAREHFCGRSLIAGNGHARAVTDSMGRSLSALFNHFDEILSWKNARPRFKFKRRDAIGFLRSFKMERARDVFMYLDPPYLVQSRRGKSAIYEHEFTDFQHIALLKLVRSMKGPMIAISGYHSALYDELLEGWRIVTFKNVVRSGAEVTEYLWCNYPEPIELHDYSYIGRDFRDRERIRRVQRNFVGKLRRLPPLERQALMIKALAMMSEIE